MANEWIWQISRTQWFSSRAVYEWLFEFNYPFLKIDQEHDPMVTGTGQRWRWQEVDNRFTLMHITIPNIAYHPVLRLRQQFGALSQRVTIEHHQCVIGSTITIPYDLWWICHLRCGHFIAQIRTKRIEYHLRFHKCYIITYAHKWDMIRRWKPVAVPWVACSRIQEQHYSSETATTPMKNHENDRCNGIQLSRSQ